MKIPQQLPTIIALLFMLWACDSQKKDAEPPEGQASARMGDERPMADLPQEPETGQKRIVFFGNSLSAGYGLDSPEKAFPGLIQQRLDSLNTDFLVVNAGVSGETTAGGRNRIDWVLKQPITVLVLELGGNDGLRGIPPAESVKNLQYIIDATLKQYPDAKIVLAGMEAPPNMGQSYTDKFRATYTTLAERNQLPLIPFLLEGVAGEPSLNLPDGIHPNEAGHKIVAENVWEVLWPVIAPDEEPDTLSQL